MMPALSLILFGGTMNFDEVVITAIARWGDKEIEVKMNEVENERAWVTALKGEPILHAIREELSLIQAHKWVGIAATLNIGDSLSQHFSGEWTCMDVSDHPVGINEPTGR